MGNRDVGAHNRFWEKDHKSNLKSWQILWWIGPHQATLLGMRSWFLYGKSDAMEHGGAKVLELQLLLLHQQESS
jgi:hypothetical protein